MEEAAFRGAAFPGANGKISFITNRDGNDEIYVMNADGSGQTNLTNNPASDQGRGWSPDGTKFTFGSGRAAGNYDVYVMNADSSGVTRLTDNPANDGAPDWSPDSTKITFRSERDGNGDGRVYRIAFTVSDGRGGSCSGTVTVGVPHDQSGPAPVDSSPPSYNSLGP